MKIASLLLNILHSVQTIYFYVNDGRHFAHKLLENVPVSSFQSSGRMEERPRASLSLWGPSM